MPLATGGAGFTGSNIATTNSKSKRLAIVQSNYIPWKGYFDLINSVDEFVLYDDMQYTKRDWRNRNRIKTPQGAQWLTIPVQVKGRYLQKICETRISDIGWADGHWAAIKQSYSRARHFPDYALQIESAYASLERETYLSRVNYRLLTAVCEILDIRTRITWSMDYGVDGSKTERLIRLCGAARATRYISGPSARDYIEPRMFEEANIALEYFDYEGYPEYPQLWGPFDHAVSVLDLIFNMGPDARACMKSFA